MIATNDGHEIPSSPITVEAIMEIQELNHVALHVSDVEASCEFYHKVMQFDRLPRPAFSFPGAWFRLGEVQELHLIGGRLEDPIGGRRGNHYALLVEDLEPWIAHLDQHQLSFEGPLNRPDGATQVFFSDPDGHIIELCTKPPNL